MLICAIDRVSRADSAFSVNVVEASDANTLESIKIQLLISLANWSADGKLRIINIRGSTFSADSSNKVEVFKAGADISDESFVESTSRDYRSRGLWRWSIRFTTFTLEEDIAIGTITRKCCQIVGGIGRTDVTETSNEIISSCTDTSLTLVYLISSADRISLDIGVADAVAHVVSKDADALAEDVVVYLINGAVDNGWLGASRGWDIGRIGDVSGCRSIGADSRGGGRGT